jgi:hypothetical protein
VHYSHTISTMFGRASIPFGRMAHVRLTQCELHLLASALERESAEAEADSRFDRADNLAWRAADLREAAR